MIRIWTVIVAIAVVFPLYGQDASTIDAPPLGVSNGARTLDLASLPLGVGVIREAGLYFRNVVLQKEFNNALEKTAGLINNEIGTAPVGYLVRVNVYVDEFGTPVVPGGNIITTIGVGTEPIDSLAEYIRKPQIEAGIRPTGLRNDSSYIWIQKSPEGLKGWGIPREFRAGLEKQASQEARRRQQLGTWAQVFGEEHNRVVQRASFWQETYESRKEAIRGAEVRHRLAALNAEMAAAEMKVNGILAEYAKAEARLARSSKYQQTLGTIASAVSIINGAVKIGGLMSDSGMPVQSTPSSIDGESEIEMKISITREQIQSETQLMDSLSIEIRGPYSELIRVDQAIQDIYGQEQIPIPERQTPPQRLLP